MKESISAEELAEILNNHRGLLVQGSQLGVALLRGSRMDVEALEIVEDEIECTEFGFIGQQINPDGQPVFDAETLEPVISILRLFVPLAGLPGFIEDLQGIVNNKEELFKEVRRASATEEQQDG